ncbi:MAG TPA: Ig-like domain-containing protein [Byssovorax sp.]
MARTSARRDRLERGALLGVAPLSIALAAAVLLGPGGARPAPFARVYGAPFGERVALRVLTSTTLFGVDEAVRIDDVRLVERRPEGDVVRWRGGSGAEGVAEAWFDAEHGAKGPLKLRVDGLGRALAAGEVARDRPHPLHSTHARLEGDRRGELVVFADVLGGALLGPFPARVVVHVIDAETTGVGVEHATVEIDAPGAEVKPTAGETDAHGDATFTLAARAPTLDATFSASTGLRRGSLSAHVPILAGAAILERRGREAFVVAPSPRDVEYVSFWGDEGRVAGQVVHLERRSDGFFEGKLAPVDAVLAAQFRASHGSVDVPGGDIPDTATLASDPLELGVTTWTASVFEESRLTAPGLTLLLDGRDAAVEAESSRAWRARRAAIYVVGAAAAVVIALILGRGRRAQRSLEAHLAEDGDEALRAARGESGLWSFLSVAIVALAFSIVAAFATFR